MTEAEQIDYRTKEGRAMRSQSRGQMRDPAREGMRSGDPILDRDGNPLTRKRVGGNDPYDIPEDIIPKGWSYQWNTVTVYNNADIVLGQQMQMYENGWRPVPASRHPGRFVPVGRTGDIIRDGMRLEERPLELTEDARREDVSVARQQMQDRDSSLMGNKANLKANVPGGFEMNPQRYRGTGGNLRMSIDPAVDVPAPSYKVADAGE